MVEDAWLTFPVILPDHPKPVQVVVRRNALRFDCSWPTEAPPGNEATVQTVMVYDHGHYVGDLRECDAANAQELLLGDSARVT